MKKRQEHGRLIMVVHFLIILLLTSLSASIIVEAESSVDANWNNVYTTVYSEGYTNPDYGYTLDAKLLGKVLRVQDNVGGWFRMIASEDGDYVFSVKAPDLERKDFLMEVLLDGNYYASFRFDRSTEIQEKTIKGVKKGQIITWWDNDNSGRGYTLLDPFYLMITIEQDFDDGFEESGSLSGKFNSDDVVSSLLGNSGCPHTSLTVGEERAEESYEYESIDKDKHLVSFRIIERQLYCQLCGDYSQTIKVNELSSYEGSHDWEWKASVAGNKQEFICSKCGCTKQVENPCSHNDYYLIEQFDGYVLYCEECNNNLNPNTGIGCKHNDVTVLYDGTVRTWYEKWDHEMHLKVKAPWKYSSLKTSDTYLSALCNDCGRVLEYNTKTGNGYDVSMPPGGLHVDTYESEFEKHNFVDGVCVDCGYVQTKDESGTPDHGPMEGIDEVEPSHGPLEGIDDSPSHSLEATLPPKIEDESEVVIDGSFGKASYTAEIGDTLSISVRAGSENANLERVTINVDGSGVDRLASEAISGTAWNGTLSLNCNAYPLNTPGTYTLKLYVSADAGDPNWAIVDYATLDVNEAPAKPDKLDVNTMPKVQSFNEAKGYIDYPYTKEDNEGTVQAREVVKGRIRYVAQMSGDTDFCKEYWFDGTKYLVGMGYSNGWCTRAVFSMALSYLGIDCTPGDISAYANSISVTVPYDDTVEKMQTKGTDVIRVNKDKVISFETMYENYQKNANYSPVYLHYTSKDHPNGHAFLIIGKKEGTNTYIALDPNYGGAFDSHMLEVELIRDEDGKLSFGDYRTAYTKDTNFQIDAIHQWKTNS